MRTLKVMAGDFVLDTSGHFTTIDGRDKARQDARVNLGKNVGLAGDGCDLDVRVGTMPDSPEALRVEVQRAIRDGFAALVDLEGRYQARDRRADERITGLGRITVQPVAGQPTRYQFRVEVKTLAGPPFALGGALVTPPA